MHNYMLTYFRWSVPSCRYPHPRTRPRHPHSPIYSFRVPAPRVPLRRAGRRRTVASVPLGGPLGPSRSPAAPARPRAATRAPRGCFPQAPAAPTAPPSRARRSSRATSSTRSAAGSAAAGSRSPGATPSARQRHSRACGRAQRRAPAGAGRGGGGGFVREEPRSVWHCASPESARRGAPESLRRTRWAGARTRACVRA
jgi:hypothetical protein